MIIEGDCVLAKGIRYVQIIIDSSGIIKSVNEKGTKLFQKPDYVFKKGCIYPGFVDIHVHAREDPSHSQDYKEDFYSASLAAINGGVVAFADMPNNPRPPTENKSYLEKQRLIDTSLVDVLLYAGIGPNTQPLEKIRTPYKLFMGPSIGNLYFENDSDIEIAIKKYKGKHISFHCESSDLLNDFKQKDSHDSHRPELVEVDAISKVISLLKKYDFKANICHVSTKKGLELIIDAKENNLPITCEVTPHHLFFDLENRKAIKDYDWLLQMNPPLRSIEDRLFLLEKFKEGRIDYLASDHAPHTLDEKKKFISGVPNLDTYGNIVGWLLRNKVPIFQIIKSCCINPGSFIRKFRPDIKLGRIEKGYLASLTVLSTKHLTQINKTDLKTKCNWSPFENMSFYGSISAVFVRGKPYFAEDLDKL
ncbi:dihydroorotase [Candidatus Woesearchaeota archaeon]|jgi:dihydroorotase|nr:dihydroorotase [Candidatus Woesearchaeota archaeon]MBT6519282.1 dihydroorotase [Candidatus Woesearchaeota archaeon]MBT7368474.1 dihydroorotase [Candidatus Woesearchaeota archaeon]